MKVLSLFDGISCGMAAYEMPMAQLDLAEVCHYHSMYGNRYLFVTERGRQNEQRKGTTSDKYFKNI